MKKIVRTFFATLLILILAGGAAFYFGWVQFKVNTDECGVLISKTSGVYPSIIEKGVFCWRWEPLLPTNAKLMTFKLKPQTFKKKITGTLPSAQVYAGQIKGTPDFAYSFELEIALRLNKESLLEKAGSADITSDEELTNYLSQTADRIAEQTAQFLIAESAKQPDAIAVNRGTEELLSGIGISSGSLNGAEVSAIFIKDAKIPDLNLYNRAKQTYMTFQDYVDEALTKSAQHQADTILSDNRAVSRLTQIGETLKKYPDLAQILKNGDSADFIKSLNATVSTTTPYTAPAPAQTTAPARTATPAQTQAPAPAQTAPAQVQ